MASLTSVSNSNYISSLYNSSNMISGLASGMDTESMIENLTKAYQTKITKLQQKSTKIGWKQDAYRSIISKMYAFSNKYTSYTSSTNLLSPAFFNSARTSTAQGENAKYVSASGTSASQIKLNSVEQLAEAARYATKGNFNAGDGETVVASEAIDLEGETSVSALKGSLNLTYGTKSVSLYFSESDIIKPEDGETNAEALARVIEDKLNKEEIVIGDNTVSAGDRIGVSVSDSGEISFYEKSSAGNSVYISSASKGLATKLDLPDLSNAKEDQPSGFTIPGATEEDPSFFEAKVKNSEKVSGKTFNIDLDGTTKQVDGPTISRDADGNYHVGDTVVKTDGLSDEERKEKLNAAYVDELNKALNKQFGNKIKVSNASEEKDKLQLKFEVPKDSDILINTDAGDALKIGKVASNYLSTGKTLGDLLGEDALSRLTPSEDDDGNTIEGKYDFVINGTKVGSYDKDTSLSKIMTDINASSAGVKVTYSKTSREFVFTTKDTGEHTEIEMGAGLASAMFGPKVDTTAKTADVLGEDVAGKKFSLNVGEGYDSKAVSFTFNNNGGSMDAMLNKLNSNLKSTFGKDYTASFANDGSLVIKDENGKSLNYSFGSDDQVAQKLTDTLKSSPKKLDGVEGYTKGQDAVFNVTVNGTTKTLTRATNKAEIDGMTLNLKGTFNEGYAEAYQDYKDGKLDKAGFNAKLKENGIGESVTFQEDIQADQVVDAVKNMIAEYNVMVAEIRSAYATMPAKNSNGSIKTYEPLTDEDRAGMSESQIQSYEEKAKQGLLFADSNLSTLYQSMVSIFNRTGEDATTMKNMGIGISYDTNGAATITFKEDDFRKALENDFDGVVDLFTRSASDGGTDGIMQSMKGQLDRYGATTGAVKGILVQQAGTPLASLSLLDNGWQKEIDNLSSQIEKVQEKLKSQVDRYVSQFTRMETLINQMNAQSSQLASLMGG